MATKKTKSANVPTKRAKPNVKHINSHNKPEARKASRKGGHGVVEVKQGVSIVEYPGERGRGKRGFGGVKIVDSRG
jgi:hypothetical protein